MGNYYESFNVIEPSEKGDYASPWGNSCLIITEEDIQALRDGKVLHHDDQELCEQTYYNSVNGDRDEGIRNNAYHNAIDIINQVETEYNNGWIPCSERLPEGEDYVLAQYADGKYIGGDDIWMAFYNHTEEHWEYETDEGLLITPKVIAWQPLPEPYKKGE